MADELGAIAKMLVEGLINTRLNGQATYSGERDYGDGFSGTKLNAGGSVSTEMPLGEYMLRLQGGGHGGRWSVKSPEELRQYGVPSRKSGTFGAVNSLAAALADKQGRSLGFEWQPGDNEKFILRGRIPF